MEKITVHEKTTNAIDMQLKSNGTVIDLTDVDHIRLDMVDKDGEIYRYSSSDVSPALTITTATTGSIRFIPPSESVFQYLKNPYEIYVWIYETSVKRYAVPEGESARIEVLKES